MTTKVGIVHPGEMGSALAATLVNTLGTAYWCSTGRSAATRKRAETAGLQEIAQLQDFCNTCEIIISVCPPHGANTVAEAVLHEGFRGHYVDANALAPATVQQLAQRMQSAGCRFTDGGIVGLPSTRSGATWLYLSGPDAAEIAHCTAAGPFATEVLGPVVGQASALKMCYAAWNKGSTALLASVLATAEHFGVRQALEQQWDHANPGTAEQASKRVTGVARKAWRFTGEMMEIAATLEQAGLPPDFFIAAAEVYRRQSAWQDVASPPALVDLLREIAEKKQ